MTLSQVPGSPSNSNIAVLGFELRTQPTTLYFETLSMYLLSSERVTPKGNPLTINRFRSTSLSNAGGQLRGFIISTCRGTSYNIWRTAFPLSTTSLATTTSTILTIPKLNNLKVKRRSVNQPTNQLIKDNKGYSN